MKAFLVIMALLVAAMLFVAFHGRAATESSTVPGSLEAPNSAKSATTPKHRLPEAVFVQYYVIANHGLEDFDDKQLAELAHDAFRMTEDDAALGLASAWDKRVERALNLISSSGVSGTDQAPQSGASSTVVTTDARALLAEFESGQATEAEYRGKKLAITGLVSALFVPDLRMQMQFAAEGHKAYPLLTMGGIGPRNAEEGLTMPGITAYSKLGSLFGYSAADEPNIAVGRPVTLRCTFDTVSEALAPTANMHYTIMLDDCVAQVSKTSKPEIIRNGIALEAPTAGSHQPGVTGVSEPTLVYSVEPEFSDEARKARYQGVVLVGLVVGADGLPKNPYILRPQGMGLDEKAIEAVKQFRFKPAMKDGNAVPMQFTVEVNFHIY